MKNLLSTLLVILLLTAAVKPQDTLTVLYLNDTHSNLAPIGPLDASLNAPWGGIARMAIFIGMNKMTEPNTIALHGGDYSIGDMFFNKYFGGAELQLLNSIGLDACGVGNHEFDIGSANLLNVLQSTLNPDSSFPFISSNLIMEDPSISALKNYIKPFTIKQVGNIKVGIFGVTTPSANLLSMPAPVFIDTNITNNCLVAIDTLTALGADFIICISHLGIKYDTELAMGIPGINLIIGSHDHYKFEPAKELVNIYTNQTCYVVQAKSFYEYAGKIQFVLTPAGAQKISDNMIHIDDSNCPEEPTVKAVVNGLIADIENTWQIPFYSQQIGTASALFDEEASFSVPGQLETAIGNFVTDAYRWKTGSDIAIQPGGSTCQPLYQGPITPISLFRVVGYGLDTLDGLGFRVVKFDLTGAEIIAGLEGTLEITLSEGNDEFLLQTSGMTYSFNPNNPAGSRVEQVFINGQPINPTATYSVSTNEFVSMALPGLLGIYPSNFVRYDSLSEFQALYEYTMSLGGVLTPTYRNSITSVPVELVSFTGSINEGIVTLNWCTATETNNRGFEVQRRYKGNWETAGFVKGSGTISTEVQYSFSESVPDESIPVISYRLKQIDYDGSFSFSNEIEINLSLPVKYELYQNYPNPFNPSTMIEYYLTEKTKVNLFVYNSLGEKVAELVNNVQPSGKYTVEFNASNLASGIYFYRLQTDNFISTKKMILLR